MSSRIVQGYAEDPGTASVPLGSRARHCQDSPSRAPCHALCEICADNWIVGLCCLPENHRADYSYSHICFECLQDILYSIDVKTASDIL